MPSMKEIDLADLLERFQKKIEVDPQSGCWNWVGANKNNGYGNAWLEGANHPAHRAIYLSAGLLIPEKMDLDHLCRNRLCVNPAHLEPVTRSENLKRGDAGENLAAAARAMTHCKRGHELTGSNTRIYRGRRHCRACARLRYHQKQSGYKT